MEFILLFSYFEVAKDKDRQFTDILIYGRTMRKVFQIFQDKINKL